MGWCCNTWKTRNWTRMSQPCREQAIMHFGTLSKLVFHDNLTICVLVQAEPSFAAPRPKVEVERIRGRSGLCVCASIKFGPAGPVECVCVGVCAGPVGGAGHVRTHTHTHTHRHTQVSRWAVVRRGRSCLCALPWRDLRREPGKLLLPTPQSCLREAYIFALTMWPGGGDCVHTHTRICEFFRRFLTRAHCLAPRRRGNKEKFDFEASTFDPLLAKSAEC